MGKDPRNWHSRGFLPHFDQGGFTQFVTFRLADSVPQAVLDKWRRELETGQLTDSDLRKRIEYYLDQNYGSAPLRRSDIAAEIQSTLLRWDGTKYQLISWVIMPNHVHLLLAPADGVSMPEIMHSIKSYTAHAANKLLERKGAFWAKEYFDRYIRDSKHFASTIAYIENNPVKARLCASAEEWPYGSAHVRRIVRLDRD